MSERLLRYHLFARPSFLEGMGRLVDFGNSLNLYNVSDSPEDADWEALLSDWEIVGDDIRRALAELEEKRACRKETLS